MSEQQSQPSPPSPTYTEAWLPGPDGHQFYTRTYAAASPRAVILFVHGFAEHVGRYEHVHPWYPKRGITVFAYDQRGYGRTALDAQHKSKDAAYGKTSWAAQLGDIECWVKHLTKEYSGVPIFLMGHSMGGGLVCAFPTRTSPPPSPETVKLLSGVIASSPLLCLTHRKPRIVVAAGSQLGRIFPSLSIPAGVKPEDLSRNAAANEAYMKDPYIKMTGTLKGVDDMLTGGEKLVEHDWEYWPKDLPALFVHGTADQVTSHKATENFYNRIYSEDKKLTLYPGAYHEMVNEIDGIPEKMFEEIVAWVEDHLPSSSTATEAKL